MDKKETNAPKGKENAKSDLTPASSIAELFKKGNDSKLWKKYYPTGFAQLDRALGGGWTTGVHYIGAISSLGKSTFSLQMADAMAARGSYVMYVSLEMPKTDLTAKLISMYTYRLAVECQDETLAQTSNSLMNEKKSKSRSRKEWEIQEAAVKKLQEHGERLIILENHLISFTVEKIESSIIECYKKYKECPIVIIDYLQILSILPLNEKPTERQNINYNVERLRILATRYHIPIIVISSFNRTSYKEKVSFSSFKDSGNIEYSSDSLIGLQLHGVGKNGFDENAARAKFPREVDLVILKQRYGPTNQKICYRFFTKYNYFEECDVLEESKEQAQEFSLSGRNEQTQNWEEAREQTQVVINADESVVNEQRIMQQSTASKKVIPEMTVDTQNTMTSKTESQEETFAGAKMTDKMRAKPPIYI
ncbi:MAG: DnaB-like helicase C-terminal domain-containing protein [Lachnospiraceae bacterium]